MACSGLAGRGPSPWFTDEELFMRRWCRSGHVAMLAVVVSGISFSAVSAQVTRRVSVSSAEVQDNTGASTGSYVTPDGRYIVFASGANDLVPGDTNGATDVFVRDRLLGTTTRVSVPDPGVTGSPTQGNGSSFLGRAGVRYCSDDGRHVVFESIASNLVNGDTNGDPPWHISGSDIFVRDRDVDGNGIFDEPGVGNTRTVRVSVTTGGSQYIEFSVGLDTYGGGCHNPSISANGRYVAFLSEADNLTTGNQQGTIGSNIYYRDRDNDNNGIYDQTGDICIIIFQNGCITAKGSTTELVSAVRCCSGQQFDGFCSDPAISGNGRYVAFVTASQWLNYDLVFDSDSNNRSDVYVQDMWVNGAKAMRVSVDSNENQNTDFGSGSPSISDSGRYVAFTSGSTQLLPLNEDTNGKTDVFVRDLGAPIGGSFIFGNGSTSRVSLGVWQPLIGSTNRFVQLAESSEQPFISPDGRFVAFVTTDSGVTCNALFGCWDTNTNRDVYMRDTLPGSETTYYLSVRASGGIAANGDSTFPSVNLDGTVVAFASVASDMVIPDANGTNSDVYVRVSAAAPQILSAASRKLHGGAAYDIPFSGYTVTTNPGGTTNTSVECRANGVTQIVVTCDQAIKATDGSPNLGQEVVVTGGTASSALISGNTLTVNMTTANQNGSCVTLTLSGISSEESDLAMPSAVLAIAVLRGDITGNGAVDIGDINAAKAASGSALNSSAVMFRRDLTINGAIDIADVNNAKALSGNSLLGTCP